MLDDTVDLAEVVHPDAEKGLQDEGAATSRRGDAALGAQAGFPFADRGDVKLLLDVITYSHVKDFLTVNNCLTSNHFVKSEQFDANQFLTT